MRLLAVALLLVMSSMAAALQFATSSAGLALGVKVAHNSSSRSTITFANTVPLTIRTSAPFVRGLGQKDVRKFTAKIPKKEAKTAIGLSFSDDASHYTRYLTPDYCSEDKYVSFGGAGFVYPSRSRAARGYAEGDTVGIECDFSKNTITFSVNGSAVKEVPFGQDVDLLFPSISCEKGLVVMETFLD